MKDEGSRKPLNGTNPSTGGTSGLTGKTIILTGGKGRLGTSWTAKLRSLGADVIVWDLPEVDVTSPESIKAAFTRIDKAAGGPPCIDGLINAAAIDAPPDGPQNDFQKVMEVNITGIYNVCQVVVPRMRSGAVVNIASMYGLVSPFWAKNPAYGASKAAVIQLTKHLAVSNPRLRVNAVSFGGVESDQPEWFKEEYASRCPLGRMARLHEYDDVIVFMLTTTYMTGSNLVVDGGWTAL